MLKKNVYRYIGCSTEYPLYENMDKFFRNLDPIVDLLNREFHDRPIYFVGRGSSGMCLATALIQRNLSWKMIYIRKEGETSHCSNSFHADRTSRYHELPADAHVIFVDDLISSGETLQICAESIREAYNVPIETVIVMNGLTEFTETTKEKLVSRQLKLPIRIISRSYERELEV